MSGDYYFQPSTSASGSPSRGLACLRRSFFAYTRSLLALAADMAKQPAGRRLSRCRNVRLLVLLRPGYRHSLGPQFPAASNWPGCKPALDPPLPAPRRDLVFRVHRLLRKIRGKTRCAGRWFVPSRQQRDWNPHGLRPLPTVHQLTIPSRPRRAKSAALLSPPEVSTMTKACDLCLPFLPPARWYQKTAIAAREATGGSCQRVLQRPRVRSDRPEERPGHERRPRLTTGPVCKRLSAWRANTRLFWSSTSSTGWRGDNIRDAAGRSGAWLQKSKSFFISPLASLVGSRFQGLRAARAGSKFFAITQLRSVRGTGAASRSEPGPAAAMRSYQSGRPAHDASGPLPVRPATGPVRPVAPH